MKKVKLGRGSTPEDISYIVKDTFNMLSDLTDDMSNVLQDASDEIEGILDQAPALEDFKPGGVEDAIQIMYKLSPGANDIIGDIDKVIDDFKRDIDRLVKNIKDY